MKVEFDIEKEFIERAIVDSITKKYSHEASEAKCGVKRGIEKAVKEYIYSKKEGIHSAQMSIFI